MFILADQRDENVLAAFTRYRQYLADNEASFPKGAFALASSDWYFDFNEHHCPHDAWLESVTVREPASGDRNEIRSVEIETRLLGAYHDMELVFTYLNVSGYDLQGFDLERSSGHGDWRYDEFRLNSNGGLTHEIEWRAYKDQRRWLIECEDVQFSHRPRAERA